MGTIRCYSRAQNLFHNTTDRNISTNGNLDRIDLATYPERVVIHQGMPPLDPRQARYPAFKRYLSDPVFYCVPSLMWIALALRYRSLTLPTAANPAMEVGGLWGESKAQGISLFGKHAREWLARCVLIDPDPGQTAWSIERVMDRAAAAGLEFPLVAKPDRGYQAWGVRKLDTRKDLEDYLGTFPFEAGIIIQEFVPYEGETGIFYVRYPGEERGRIVSMAFTYAPHVVGDGRRTVEALILADSVLAKNKALYAGLHGEALKGIPGRGEAFVLAESRSARMGAIYRNAQCAVTPDLEARIDGIAQDIRGFHFGRFDIRFADVETLKKGEAFQIVEVNGSGAEMLHFWDGSANLAMAYRTLWRQYRMAFEIGARNVGAGHRAAGIRAMIARRQMQERLRKQYPAST